MMGKFCRACHLQLHSARPISSFCSATPMLCVDLEARFQTLSLTGQRVKALIEYHKRELQHLQVFNGDEKRLAFEAFNL